MCVNLVVILGVGVGIVELHVILPVSVVVLEDGTDEGDVAALEAGMLKRNFLGLLLADGIAGAAGALLRAGAAGGSAVFKAVGIGDKAAVPVRAATG